MNQDIKEVIGSDVYEKTQTDTSVQQQSQDISGFSESGINSAQIPSPPEKKKRCAKHTRTPLIIAACIFVAVSLFFGVMKCFFDSSFEGTWGVDLTVPDTNESVNYRFSFSENNTVRYQSGGQAAIGRYYLDVDEGENVVNMYFTNNGANMVAKFGYSFSGNIFTGRQLSLKDLSGFFFAPDNDKSDEAQVKAKKTITDSVEKDGATYYVWNMTPSQEVFKQDSSESFEPDEKLCGIWYAKSENSENLSYTIVFNKDGSFEQRNYENEIYGIYSVENGKCSIRYYAINGSKMGADLDYSIENGKLTLGTHEFVKTNDKYAYQSEN